MGLRGATTERTTKAAAAAAEALGEIRLAPVAPAHRSYNRQMR